MPNDDAQFLETRKFGLVDVANWFSVPPHKVGADTNTSYKSLEEENQSYFDDGLDPWLCTLEDECRDKLLTEEEKAQDTHVVEFLRQALMRANLKDRGLYYNLACGGPWVTVNQVRGYENMNPSEDEEADKIRQPKNTGVFGDGGSAKAAPPEQKAVALDAHRKLVEDALRRMAKRVAVHALKAARGRGDFRAWIATCEDEHRAVVMDALAPALEASAVVTGHEVTPEQACALFFSAAREFLLEGGDCAEAVLQKRIEEFQGKAPDALAQTIVRVADDE